jgi:hypothetical protein
MNKMTIDNKETNHQKFVFWGAKFGTWGQKLKALQMLQK